MLWVNVLERVEETEDELKEGDEGIEEQAIEGDRDELWPHQQLMEFSNTNMNERSYISTYMLGMWSLFTRWWVGGIIWHVLILYSAHAIVCVEIWVCTLIINIMVNKILRT